MEKIDGGFISKKTLKELALHGCATYVPKNAIRLKYSENRVTIAVLNVEQCPECEKAFALKRKDQVYCSKRCGARVRNREYRARKKEA